ncbi:MAG: AMP-binding protein, partial [Spirochaetia bacterium]|nr:AMP-binding protein [Spirochaetia bacterium]
MFDMTLGEMLRYQTKKDPEHEFLVYPDRDLRLTYAQFDHRVDLLAKGLLAIGIKRGDHVGMWATNVPDWLTFLFSCA